MHKMMDLRDKLAHELDEMDEKTNMNYHDLKVIDKLTDSIKNIDTIIAMAKKDGTYHSAEETMIER